MSGPTPARDRSGPAIAGIGAYAPRLRIDAAAFEDALGRFEAPGVDRKAVADADEDALTMAYEAARRALDAGGVGGSDVAHLSFATTTPPMAEEDLTARLTSALGTPETVQTRTLTGSTRAGGQALGAALDAGPRPEGVGLVVASDCPRGAPDGKVEHAAGAGAAALVLDDDGPGTVLDRVAAVESYPGTRFRPTGDDETTGLGITGYDREAFASVLGSAADDLDADPSTVDAAAVQAPDGKLPYRAADALGVDADAIAAAETASELGDTGAASAFLGLAAACETGTADTTSTEGGDTAAGGIERALLATWGSGAGADLFVLDGLDEVPVAAALDGDVDLTYAEYLRRRGELASGEPEGGGAYVSVPSWQRTAPQRHRLVAGECPVCGALAFPPEGACRNCRERPDAYDPVELPGTGTIEALTTVAQGGAPPEFLGQQARSGPYVSAVVALDGPDGAFDGDDAHNDLGIEHDSSDDEHDDSDNKRSVSVPTQVLAPGERDASIGAPVEATIRRIYRQEGVVRYGFKVQLAEDRR